MTTAVDLSKVSLVDHDDAAAADGTLDEHEHLADYITVLQPYYQKHRVRKMILANGKVIDADRFTHFNHRQIFVGSIDALARLVEKLTARNLAVIRGGPACSRQPLHRQIAFRYSRGDEGFLDVPRRLIILDVDGVDLPAKMDGLRDIDDVVEYVVGQLPEVFQQVSIVWQLTGTHGLAFDECGLWTGGFDGNRIRLRLFALVDRAISSAEAVAWTRAMSGPLKLDASVSYVVQLNYTARSITHDGRDPLQPLIDKGLCVTGIRRVLEERVAVPTNLETSARWDGGDPLQPLINKGLRVTGIRRGVEDRVAVPTDLEKSARWARAEGHGMHVASHPTAEAAISGIGMPIHEGGRPEIRSHLWSAAHHLLRAQQSARGPATAHEIAKTIREMTETQREKIQRNLEAGNRRWSEVTNYTETDDVEKFVQWMLDNPLRARAGDGGGGRKRIRRIAKVPEKPGNWISLEEGRALVEQEFATFIDDAEVYLEELAQWQRERRASERRLDDLSVEELEDNPSEDVMPQKPSPPRRMVAATTGTGKTEVAIQVIGNWAKDNKPAWFLVPHHKLSDELAGRIYKATSLKAAVWRGRRQPDPKAPGNAMCLRLEDVNIVEELGLSVGKTLCRSCPLATSCGYRRQELEAKGAFVIIAAHQVLVQGAIESLPEPSIAIIDENAIGVAIGTAEIDLSALASGLAAMPPSLLAARKALSEALGDLPDGGVRAGALQPILSMTHEAGLLEWKMVTRPLGGVSHLSGDALRKALAGIGGARAAKVMERVWQAVMEARERPSEDILGRLQLETSEKRRLLRVSWLQQLSERWRDVPLMFLDATADEELLKLCFGVRPAPRIMVRSSAVNVRQVVDRAFSHSAIVPRKGKRADGTGNAVKLRVKLITDALLTYGGAPVLAVVPKGTAEAWNDMPPWLTIITHGSVSGLDAWGKVRAVYVIGRILLPSSALEEQAGILRGVAPTQKGYAEVKRVIACKDGSGVEVGVWSHPDELCERLRWQYCEAGLIQAAGRGRGALRSRGSPLDIVIWSDVPLPELGPVEPELWQGPDLDDELLAAGCWLEIPIDAARVWPHIASAASLKKARQRSGEEGTFAKKDILLSKCPSFNYRPQSRSSHPGLAVFRDQVSAQRARQFLETHLGPLALFEVVEPAENCNDAKKRRLDDIVYKYGIDLIETQEETDLLGWHGGPIPSALYEMIGWTSEMVGMERNEVEKWVLANRHSFIANSIRRHSPAAFAELRAA